MLATEHCRLGVKLPLICLLCLIKLHHLQGDNSKLLAEAENTAKDYPSTPAWCRYRQTQTQLCTSHLPTQTQVRIARREFRGHQPFPVVGTSRSSRLGEKRCSCNLTISHNSTSALARGRDGLYHYLNVCCCPGGYNLQEIQRT